LRKKVKFLKINCKLRAKEIDIMSPSESFYETFLFAGGGCGY